MFSCLLNKDLGLLKTVWLWVYTDIGRLSSSGPFQYSKQIFQFRLLVFLISFLPPHQNLSLWVKAVKQKASASIHIRSQALGERRDGRRGGVETDWASATEHWVSLWVGVWRWRKRKRNPAESFWRRMLSSPPGLAGMRCRRGCYTVKIGRYDGM